MHRQITPQTSLDNLRKEAKRRLRESRANDRQAGPKQSLREMQHAIAREFGMPGWAELKRVLGYEQLARDMVAVYRAGDDAALQRIHQHYGNVSSAGDLRALVWRMMYRVRKAKAAADAFQIPEAQELIARTSGFENWSVLTAAIATGAPPSVPAFAVEASEGRLSTKRNNTASEWEVASAVIQERRLTALAANGFMTDEALAHICELDHVIALDLSGSRGLTDAGLLQLARMPQLERLELNEYPGGKLTDSGLDVLRRLPNLKVFRMCWQGGISDAGVANLRYCEKLEEVDLMGSPTGDGAIEALRGKASLRKFQTGRLVTDAGLSMLREFPRFRTAFPDEETALLVDGPITNSGWKALVELEGVRHLDLFWHVKGLTSDAFEVLPRMTNLESFGCDGELSNDRAMSHYAAIPRLKKLRAQGTAATDEGFIALSASRSLADLWTRTSPKLTSRGFAALSRMPALRSLGVGCEGVDDEGLSTLPDFPALRHFTAAGVADGGFRYVGQCAGMEKLWCMYCRETTDCATEHIAPMNLKIYYAGGTKITDRSLEILGQMDSLESVELYGTKGVTDAGIARLSLLPRLRELKLSELPQVTYAALRRLPSRIKLEWNV